MKTLTILLAALFMTGCATTPGTTHIYHNRVGVAVSEVIATTPVIIGTYTSAIIFGGQVAYVPHPTYYVSNQVNWQTRYVYNSSRRYVRERATPTYRHKYYNDRNHRDRKYSK